MGANAQTTVPTFTASQVLTADQQNQSARTGVPVFATTVERDGAFGGTGEKVLAEGQLCYLESTNVVQYFDGSSWDTVGPAAASGLTLISSTTIGSAVSSVTITGAFSSTYDNYYVTVSGGVASTTNFGRLTLGATATGYYKSTVYMAYNSNTVNGISNANATYWDDTINGTTNSLHGAFYLFGPNLAKTTHFVSTAAASTTTGQSASNLGYLNDTTQYTAFTITANTGTFTGGTIRVYGLQN